MDLKKFTEDRIAERKVLEEATKTAETNLNFIKEHNKLVYFYDKNVDVKPGGEYEIFSTGQIISLLDRLDNFILMYEAAAVSNISRIGSQDYENYFYIFKLFILAGISQGFLYIPNLDFAILLYPQDWYNEMKSTLDFFGINIKE